MLDELCVEDLKDKVCLF